MRKLTVYTSEGLCDKLLRSDVAKFGEVPEVTNKEWYHNSFHVASNYKLSATDKLNLEAPLFHRSNGGHICYNEFYTVDNFEAFSSMINYAMELGLYYGINLELGSCKDCDYEGSIFSTCPSCKSTNVSGITRCCGYLGHKIKDGETRYNKGKDAEVDNRVRHFDIEVKHDCKI